jgi:hypothetical protein
MPELTHVLRLLNDIENDVYAAYGRAMARAQDFEIALAVYAFGRRRIPDPASVDDSEAHVEYGLKLVRMTAGQRAKELGLPTAITDDIATMVSVRNHLAHTWFRGYAEGRGGARAHEDALAELAGAEAAFHRRAFALLAMLTAIGHLGDLPDDEAVRIWQRHAHDMDEPDS